VDGSASRAIARAGTRSMACAMNEEPKRWQRQFELWMKKIAMANS